MTAQRIGTPLHDATSPRDWGTEAPPEVDVPMGQTGIDLAAASAPDGADIKVGSRLIDAADVADGDPRATLRPPYPEPVITAAESRPATGPVLSVRCPHCGRTHHHGRIALPAYVHGSCGGPYTIERVAEPGGT